MARYTFLGLKRYNLGTIKTGKHVRDNLFYYLYSRASQCALGIVYMQCIYSVRGQ